jgi:hypothetical protein
VAGTVNHGVKKYALDKKPIHVCLYHLQAFFSSMLSAPQGHTPVCGVAVVQCASQSVSAGSRLAPFVQVTR